MKVLVIHPADDPMGALSKPNRWDRVIDLGFAGPSAYKSWSESLGCPVGPVEKLDAADLDQVRDALCSGLGVLVDQYGLDWWELIAFEFHQQLEQVVQMKKLAASFGPGDEVFITRSGFHTDVLELLLDRPVRALSRDNSLSRKLRHYGNVITKFSAPQLWQILGDKYDTGYQLRRLLADPHKTLSRPVVLLPSAYINVTRTELQYAAMLPDSDFLLVTTRQSGQAKNASKNVAVAKIASYAPGDISRNEFAGLLGRWNQLKRDLMQNQILSVLIRCGALNSFPKFLRDGLMIRDAWLEVFEREPVRAVLCADEANLPTRIPLLIAAHRGLPAISCHHGALDGRHRFRSRQECLFLAKGRMEQDYLVRECRMSAENVEIGAPSRPQIVQTCVPGKKRSIVFFSEPYEILGGRCAQFYNESLPPLAQVAAASGHELVLKLHPVENLRDRVRLANASLSAAQRKLMRVVTGHLTDELLGQTWCAVTIVSTTAIDCALRHIPVFVCQWLDYSHYGYGQQFTKFEAGVPLSARDEIASIPARLAEFSAARSSDLWQPLDASRLEELLSGTAVEIAAAV
jgi:hypothetical protein